jgi:hypothetical protein
MATDYTKCSIGFVALGNGFENLATAMSFFGNLLDYMWLRTPLKRVRLPQRRTIGKEHKGYARPSRQRIHQRRGYSYDKIMIAAAAIILIIELIPLIIGLIFGFPISEILPIMGVMLVSQFFGVLLSYVIISIIEWALD